MLQHTRLIVAGADHSVDGHLHPVDGSVHLTRPRAWAINERPTRRERFPHNAARELHLGGGWAALARRRVGNLRRTACRELLDGIDAVGIVPDRVPRLSEVDARLARLTGWTAVPVSGFLPAPMYSHCLASDEQREAMRRLLWFTVEFGLVREAARPRSMGVGSFRLLATPRMR